MRLILGWDPALRGQGVDGFRQRAGQAREQLIARQACLLREIRYDIGAQRAFQLIGRNRLVRPLSNPGFGSFSLTRLLEPVDQVAQAAAQDTAGRGASQDAAETAQESTKPFLLLPATFAGRSVSISVLHATNDFSQFFPVLVAR